MPKVRDVLLLLLLGLLLGFGMYLVQVFTPSQAAVVQGVFLFLATSMVILACYRRLLHTHNQLHNSPDGNYRQVESLFSVFALLDIRRPIPPMRGSVISPDFANTLISIIMERKPSVIVELGSGVSTLIAAYSIDATTPGHIYSLDHDANYAAMTARHLDHHGLSHVATVRHAPLILQTVEGESCDWYDSTTLHDVDSIDVLVVDGPPQVHQPAAMARYPALPVFYSRLAQDAVIIVDDCNRDAEALMIRRWREQYPDFECEMTLGEKRHVVLRRRGGAQRSDPA
jgi:predicted O-methyltransferase YrrM